MKEALDDVAVYEWHEVEQFNDRFFSNADADQLNPLIDTATSKARLLIIRTSRIAASP